MGAADAVPGVSGGTIALITGIYERLIRALTALDPTVLRRLFRVHRSEQRIHLWRALVGMDVPFLVVLGTGMVTAVVLLARIVQVALSVVPALTFAFFFGLIAASAVALYDRRWLVTPAGVLAAITGFSVAFLVAGATADGALPHTLPVVFVSGMFAISGMVLPGISGAFILLLLGQYDFMTDALNRFVDGVITVLSGNGTGDLLEASPTVVAFIVGAFIGLLTVAYAVRWALERYRGPTFAFLVSLMLGALRYPGLQITQTTDTWSSITVSSILAAGFLGAGLVLVLDRYTDDLDYEDV